MRDRAHVTPGRVVAGAGVDGGVYCFPSEAPGGPREASPSLVYGAALLMRLGVRLPPGFKSRSLRGRGPARVEASQVHTAPVAQRIEHLTTDQKVRGSNPFGRAPVEAAQRGRSNAAAPLFCPLTATVDSDAAHRQAPS